LAAWTCVGGLTIVVQHIAAYVRPVRPLPTSSFWSWHGLFSGWAQWDSFAYIEIGVRGYHNPHKLYPTVAWFPGYPLIARLVLPFTNDVRFAFVFVSLVFGLVATICFWQWLERHAPDDRTRLFGLAVGLLFPFAWFLYGVIYADSLFLAAVIGAFVLADRRHYVWAGLVGVVATATRPLGFALVVGLIAIAFGHDHVWRVPDGAKGVVARFAIPMQVRWKRIRPHQFWGLLALVGVGGYMAYTAWRFDDVLLFMHAQRSWHHGPGAGLKSFLKLGVAREALIMQRPAFVLATVSQGLVVLAVAISVPFVGRRYGWGYGVYTAVLVAMVFVGTRDFIGSGRYLLAAFPSAALLGEWLARRPVAQAGAYLLLGAGALYGMTVQFSRGAYIT
jgi:hypothetical protein